MKTLDRLLFFMTCLPDRRHYAWLLAGLSGLGIAASLAESLGISFAVFLLTTVMTGGHALNEAGILGHVLMLFQTAFGGSALMIGCSIFTLLMIKIVCNMAYGLAASKMRHTLSHEVRNKIYGQFMDLPYLDVAQKDRGLLLNVLSAESWAVADACSTLSRIVVNLFAVLIFGCFVVAISWKMAVLAALGAAIVLIIGKVLSRPARTLTETVIAQKNALADEMIADIQGLRTIRLFGVETFKKESFGRLSLSARNLFIRIDRFYAYLGPVNEMSYLVFLGLLVYLSSTLNVPAPAALTAILLLYRLQPTLRELDGNRLGLAGNLASLDLLRPFLDLEKQSISEPGRQTCPDLSRGALCFENIGFSFDAQREPVFAGLNLDIPLGRVTLITGASGVGKSTLVNLLMRLYTPTFGQILVNGVPLPTIDRLDWLKRVSLSGQDLDLITGTIEENLTLSRPGISAETLKEAITLCGVDEFVNRLPQGLQTRVGDRGHRLSGGQRQRLGLARALLMSPQILVLDEALSAVQSHLEKQIYDRLINGTKDRTLIIITHRPEVIDAPDHRIDLAQAVLAYAG